MNAQTSLIVAALALSVAGCGDQSDRPTGLEPVITAVTPVRAGLPGGAAGTITGANFLYAEAGTPIVVVGGAEVAATVVDDATITFTVPPGHVGGEQVDVAVFNGNGYAMAADAITYNDPPAVFALDVSHTPARGGEVVTLTGRGFAADAAGPNVVTFGDATTDEVTVVDDTTLEVVAPAMAASDTAFKAITVSIANDNGSASAPTTFRYTRRALLLFGNNRNRRVLVLDPATFEVFDTGILTSGLSSYAVADDGTAWAVASSPRQLLQFDPLGTTTIIGTVSDNGQDRPSSDLVLIGDEAFSYSRSGSVFGKIDLATAAFTQIGAPLGLPQGGVSAGLGYRNESSVYFAQRLSEPLRAISTLSGAMSVLAPMAGPADRYTHGIVTFDGTTYLLAHDRNTTSWVYEVDPTTGELTERASVLGIMGAIGPTPPSYE